MPRTFVRPVLDCFWTPPFRDCCLPCSGRHGSSPQPPPFYILYMCPCGLFPAPPVSPGGHLSPCKTTTRLPCSPRDSSPPSRKPGWAEAHQTPDVAARATPPHARHARAQDGAFPFVWPSRGTWGSVPRPGGAINRPQACRAEPALRPGPPCRHCPTISAGSWSPSPPGLPEMPHSKGGMPSSTHLHPKPAQWPPPKRHLR